MKRAPRAKRNKTGRLPGWTRVTLREVDPKSACTNLAIDESVQADQVVEMQIGAFRKGLKAVLDGEQAVVLGSSWRPRGIVVPVQELWRYDGNHRDVRKARLMRLFVAALEALHR